MISGVFSLKFFYNIRDIKEKHNIVDWNIGNAILYLVTAVLYNSFLIKGAFFLKKAAMGKGHAARTCHPGA